MTTTTRLAYWQRYIDNDGRWRGARRPEGADLAALRRGIGRAPGTVPGMWPYYTGGPEHDVYADPRSDTWQPHPAFVAQHHALTLYGLHQQSQTAAAHKPGVGVGAAVAALHRVHGASSEAIDRRFLACVSAASVDELAVHLRGLITQLKGVTPLPAIDYDQLTKDLTWWPDPDRRTTIRRRWGLDYQQATRPDTTETEPEEST